MEHLTVRNFGPISDLDIDIKKVNVFIGEQGVGKSTIAKLLSVCRDIYLYYTIAHGENKDKISYLFGIYGIHEYFKKNTFIKYSENEGFSVQYTDGKFSLYTNNLKIGNNVTELTEYLLSEGLKGACSRLGYKFENMSEEEFSSFLNKNYRIVASHLRASFYCPAERGITTSLVNSMASITLSEVPLPLTLLEYISFFEKARNEFQSYRIPFLNLTYKFNDGKDIVSVKKVASPLKYSSSGIQSILPLLMVIDYCLQKKYFSSFTVEEPELNLFPTNQMELLRALISKTNRTESELGSWTMTTHSPYLLSILNISLLAGVIESKFPDSVNELYSIFPKEYIIRPDDAAVYSLSASSDTPYCSDIIDKSTGLIQGNYLDTVSDIISSEFNSLHRAYMKLLRKSN